MPWPSYKNAPGGFTALYVNDYTAKPLEDGEFGPMLTDNYRRLILSPSSVISTTTNPLTGYTVHYASTALEHQGVIKASAGTLAKVTGRIDSTCPVNGPLYLQIYDSAAVPADGAVTLLKVVKIEYSASLGVDEPFDIDFEPGKLPASNGISWAISTTEFTKTVANTALAFVDALGF